ncbi:MAG: ABC transporter ATP-binding protein [Kiritimatiellaeota bacterium]|nr:ABC transporter ATP-binding protein [Kiritimatiellota bacterium]
MNGTAQQAVILAARAVSKTYTLDSVAIDVLQGVSLEVRAGETLAIMGASGAGKSTLLHCLGGLDRPTSGAVEFQGRDIYALSGAARTEVRATKIGFVFQAYHLLPELDLLENVMLPALSRRGALARRAQLAQRGLALLDSVGLRDRAAHRPAELSGGEQQRAALARSLMNEPELVLADEPTGNLDSHTGRQVLDYLFRLTRGRGHTLVLVTHNAEVAALCDRALILRDGRLS